MLDVLFRAQCICLVQFCNGQFRTFDDGSQIFTLWHMIVTRSHPCPIDIVSVVLRWSRSSVVNSFSTRLLLE